MEVTLRQTAPVLSEGTKARIGLTFMIAALAAIISPCLFFAAVVLLTGNYLVAGLIGAGVIFLFIAIVGMITPVVRLLSPV